MMVGLPQSGSALSYVGGGGQVVTLWHVCEPRQVCEPMQVVPSQVGAPGHVGYKSQVSSPEQVASAPAQVASAAQVTGWQVSIAAQVEPPRQV